MTQQKAAAFPGIGHVYRAEYGHSAFDLDFHSATEMTYTGLKGQSQGKSERVAITITPLHPGEFAITWYEAVGVTVVDIENFAEGKVTTIVRTSKGDFVSLYGTLEQVR